MIKYTEENNFVDMEIDTNDTTYKGVFSNCRIERETVPAGKFMYQLRYGDDDSIPCTIENSVTVNLFGTFITDNPIEIDDHLEIVDWSFGG